MDQQEPALQHQAQNQRHEESRYRTTLSVQCRCLVRLLTLPQQKGYRQRTTTRKDFPKHPLTACMNAVSQMNPFRRDSKHALCQLVVVSQQIFCKQHSLDTLKLRPSRVTQQKIAMKWTSESIHHCQLAAAGIQHILHMQIQDA